MSDQQLPITTPPRRCNEHPALTAATMLGNLHGSESCKNSPLVPRRLEPYHHSLLESGSQSAQNSPLPNRRLDKLQGVIRDKSSPLCGRRGAGPEEVDFSDSPIVSRKFNQVQDCVCAPKLRASTAESSTTAGCVHRIESEFSKNSPMMAVMRKRGDSDCSSCMRKNIIRNQFSASVMRSECGGGGSSCESTPLLRRKEPFPPGSPAKGVLGEPGVFSSPVHHGKSSMDHTTFGGFPTSPAKSVLGEPGVFSSPARSVCSPTGEDTVGEGADVLANDQTIVSGWLKFRDNKKEGYNDIPLFNKKSYFAYNFGRIQ
ncbi:AAEL005971-PA [Aedes aegypti]|uniref:AAEL005971-PA n=1 Tax=Aedes aegypti TaxID=7159 RepID=Q178B9_AEDAE|nr:AAEL005971-PA [Aedes aegypti]